MDEASRKNLQAMMDHMGGRLALVLSTGTYSAGFQLELAFHALRRGYNTFAILDDVAVLEGRAPGPSRTKSAAPFKGPHLMVFWHKHHFQARFLPKNMRLELERSDVVERALRPHMGEEVTPEIIKRLVHAAVVENFEARSGDGRLTGEWIVYRRDGGRHHYITLASHREGDEAVAARISEFDRMDAEVAARGTTDARPVPGRDSHGQGEALRTR